MSTRRARLDWRFGIRRRLRSAAGGCDRSRARRTLAVHLRLRRDGAVTGCDRIVDRADERHRGVLCEVRARRCSHHLLQRARDAARQRRLHHPGQCRSRARRSPKRPARPDGPERELAAGTRLRRVLHRRVPVAAASADHEIGRCVGRQQPHQGAGGESVRPFLRMFVGTGLPGSPEWP